MKLSTIIRTVVLSAILTPATYASDTAVYSPFPVAVYINQGEDCALPLEGYEDTDWFPHNYYPLMLPVWEVSQANYLEHNINNSPVPESLTYIDGMTEIQKIEMLKAMKHYVQSIIDTDDQDYIDCLSIVNAID